MQISIVDRGGHLTRETRQLLKRRLLFALSRFDSRVARVTAIVSDVNGPRGGIDKRCMVKAKLPRVGDLVVSHEDSNVEACMARAADRMGRTVSRAIARDQAVARRRTSVAQLQ